LPYILALLNPEISKGKQGEMAYKGNRGNWHDFSQLLKFPVSKQHIQKNYSILKLTNRK